MDAAAPPSIRIDGGSPMTAPWIAAFVALWVLVVLVALTVAGLLRRLNGILEQAESRPASDHGGWGISPGARVPEFFVRRPEANNPSL
jgi:hypothetical protein